MSPTRLEQKKFPRRKQIYELLADHKIQVHLKSLVRTESWQMSLAGFKTEPTRIRRIHLAPLIVVIPLGLLTLILLVSAIVAMITGKFFGGLLGIGVVLGLMTFAFYLKIVSGSANVLCFNSEQGSRIALWYENPNRAEFDDFVAALKSAIEKAENFSAEGTHSMSVELKRLAQLRDDGVLSGAEFEAAKNKILGLDRGRMGF